jgi:hypothetical protein
MSVNSQSIVKRTPGLMSTRVENDTYILNPMRDQYTGLDEIGRRIWDLLESASRVDRLCDQVVHEYQGDAQQITSELFEFLNELETEGLLEVQ